MKKNYIALIVLGLTTFAGSAQAQLVVQGKGDAARCYDYAITGNKGSRTAIETCSDAFRTVISRKDRAATHVNRGVLYMRKGDQERAMADYTAALDIKPDLIQAYVNQAASLIRQKKYDAALESLNIALENRDSPTRTAALYNRAIILDWKKDYRGAYKDLKEALTIRPEWEPALKLISRYDVRPAG
jgi:tetratricopeptide (TPR) repeat protein